MSSSASLGRPAIATIYDDKPAGYFSNARHDIIALLKTNADAAILELGCGSGGTGRAAIAAGKANRYVGLELNETAGKIAAESLSEVIIGDVQTLDLSAYENQFDALIISEVLEHLTDPWTTLERLVRCVRIGGEIYASSPNISYWKIIARLISGRFEYQASGMMDQTHLRWFTPKSFRRLFQSAGVEIQFLRPMRKPGWKAGIVSTLTAGRLDHLFIAQMFVRGYRSR
jgi:2-polyprenyl-3-methyl-5-hydroxy-6-metoxy-1,4-benzoquinol methylase